MPAPGIIEFGAGKSFAQVRLLNSDDEKLTALKGRLDNYLIEQVEAITQKDGKDNDFSAFPIAAMTCVGIATLGEIFFHHIKQDSPTPKTSVGRNRFITVLNMFHAEFGTHFSQSVQDQIYENWEVKKPKSATDIVENPIDSYSALVYTYFRNKIVHTFRGEGVFLGHDITDFQTAGPFLILNPIWFWRRFKTVYESLFLRARIETDLDTSWKSYFETLINH